MDVGELLSELRSNILRDVSDELSPQDAGRLWSDPTLVRYINDGQNQFAVKTLFLRDETTPAITQLTLVEGQEVYPLDPRVVAVLGARTDRIHLSRTTYGGLLSNAGDLTIGGLRRGPCANGQPVRFYTDRETGKLGVWPAPDASWAGKVLTLRVARKPLKPLLAADLKAVPEIPEEYQLDILEWAAWRALRNHDVDGENMAKANSHKKRFEDTANELARQARRLLAQDIQFDVRTNWER